MAETEILPESWPVAMCSDPYDPESLPWMLLQVATQNHPSISTGTRSIPIILRYFNEPGACGGIYGVAAPTDPNHRIPIDRYVSYDELGYWWKFVPTTKTREGHPIFQLYNRATNKPITRGTINSSGSSAWNWGMPGQSRNDTQFTVSGVVFDSVTTDSPQLPIFVPRPDGSSQPLPKKNLQFKWIVTVDGGSEALWPSNLFTKHGTQCPQRPLNFGLQFNTNKTDPADEPVITAYVRGMESITQKNQWGIEFPNWYWKLIVPNPSFEQISMTSSCIITACYSQAASYGHDNVWSKTCIDYLKSHPGDTTLATILTPYCSDPGTTIDRVMSRTCSYWCQAGLPSSAGAGDQGIHSLCYTTRRGVCSTYYDKSQVSGWALNTSDDIKSQCACYMPDAFYAQLLGKNKIPSGTTPNCYYKPCYSSPQSLDYFGPSTCPGVAICIQEGGEVTNTTCSGISIPPPDPVTQPEGPGSQPDGGGTSGTQQPNGTVTTSGWGWLFWILLGVVLVIIVVVLFIIYFTSKKTSNTDVLTDMLVEEVLTGGL